MTILCTGFWRMRGQKPSATKVSTGEEHRLRAKLEAQIKQMPDLPCVAVGKSLNLSEFPFPRLQEPLCRTPVLEETLHIAGAQQVRASAKLLAVVLWCPALG